MHHLEPTSDIPPLLPLHRFLTVHPTTADDVSLLTSVLQFLSDLLGVPASVGLLVGQTQLEWLARTTAGHETVCLQLLHSSLQSVEHKHNTDPYRCVCVYVCGCVYVCMHIYFSVLGGERWSSSID